MAYTNSTTYDFFVPSDLKEIFNEAINVGIEEPKDKNNILAEMDKIIEQMELWYKEFEKDREEFERIRERNNILIKKTAQYEKFISSETNKTYRQFVAMMYGKKEYQDIEVIHKNKRRSSLSQLNKDYHRAGKRLTKTFLKGYVLWESFRSLAVGQTINFSILYKNSGKLYEAESITILDLIKRGKFKLELEETKTGLSYKIGLLGLQALTKEKMPDISKELEEEDRKYTNAVFYNQLVEKYGAMYHKWVVYEVYVRFKTFRDFPLNTGVTERWFNPEYDKFFNWLYNEFNEASADWANGRKVGDYLNLQMKDLTGQGAHLSAIQTLPKDIKKLIDSYKTSTSGEDFVNSLKFLLTEDVNKKTVHLDEKTKKMNEDAQKYLDDLLKPITSISGVTES